jgi:hypothetical protein
MRDLESAETRASERRFFKTSGNYKSATFLFSIKDLRIARSAADLVGTPIWSVERARKKTENLTQRLGSEIAAVSRRKADYVAILSAENLSNPGMAARSAEKVSINKH